MKRLLFLGIALCLAWSVPAAAQSTPLGEVSQQKAGFSQALAAHGDYVFAGEAQNTHTPGRVYVYTPSEDGWSEATYLEANDGKVGDAFGASLDVADGTLVVGAPSANAVYIFNEQDGSWSQSARLTPSDSTTNTGMSVALSGDQLFVTSMKEGEDESERGVVHRFARQQDGSWMYQETLMSSNVAPGERFGRTLAASGDHLLVGAPRASGGGSVIAFRRDGNSWSEVQSLSMSALSGSAQFGSTLRWADDRVLIGAPRAYDATGVVYSFSYDESAQSWSADGRLLPYDGMQRHLFGAAVAYDGSDLWVGAPGASEQAGALYRFAKQDSTWGSATRLSHPGTEAGDRLGATLASGTDVIATGLVGDDYGAGTMALYSTADGEWTQTEPIAPTSGDVLSAITGEEVDCSDGTAKSFTCNKVDLKSFLPIKDIGGKRGIELNDIWGWTDPQTGERYALVGRTNGTSFVNITDPANPVYVGQLPLTDGARVNSWRDIKVYNDHAYIVADNAGKHGMQIFDLTQLRDVDGEAMPKTFDETAIYNGIHSAHNVVINTDTGYGYIVGSSGGGNTCGGGLHMVNLENPTSPSFEGCFSDPSTGRSGTGYSHDAQCVVYEGPDQEYQGREICIGANETAISIADVTNKDNPKAISTGSYPDHAYVHQGWLSENHRYFYQNDELDELQGKAERTRTLVWDLKDLDNPKLVNEKLLSEPTTDHNLYIKGETMYQANYYSGLRILDISDRTNPQEVAHFDTEPFGENRPGFDGAWSVYPYFENGPVIVSSIGQGLFVVDPSQPEM